MTMRTYDTTTYASQGNFAGEATSQEDSVSVFDRYSSFDGTFNLTRDLRVEGQVKGTITCQGTLFVAQGASVNATVDAENISVAGDLDGEIVCRGKLQILSTGKVHGKLTTASLVINEGAVYEGELVMETGDARGQTRDREYVRPRTTAPISTATATPIAEDPRNDAPAAAAGGGNTFIRRFGGQEASWDQSAENADDAPES
jgi:cytoskeletal protein CcmA (bactofilin family)